MALSLRTQRRPFDAAVLPTLMRNTDRWAGWKFSPPQPSGRCRKTPTDPATGRPVNVGDPANLWPLDALLNTAGADRFDGLGFALDPDGELIGLDLDDVVDPATGELSAMAAGIVDDLPATYIERSPRGGLHGLALGKLDPDGRCRAKVAGLGWGQVPANLEVYPRRRVQFLTITGDVLDGRAGLLADHGHYMRGLQASLAPKRPALMLPQSGVGFDGDVDALLSVARRASNGPRLWRLWCGDWSTYASPSDALLALANYLAFWTGPDYDRLFALMTVSPLVAATEAIRPKWWTPRPRGVWGLSCVVVPAIRDCRRFFGGLPPAVPQKKPPHRGSKSVRSAPGDRLIEYCRRLGRGRPDGVFHLSVRAAGKAAGLRRSQAAVLLRRLVADGVLTDVDKAKPTPRPGPASTFRLLR